MVIVIKEFYVGKINISNSFNDDFCATLEFHLCKTFRNSHNNSIKQLWCDGIVHIPENENQLVIKEILSHNKLITKAWIGSDGQTEYEATIYFGKQSQKCILQEESIIDCIPSAESMDWIQIDTENQTIKLSLL